MQKITFSEKVFGTVDPVYYCKINTITFQGLIWTDTAQPNSPVIAGNSTYDAPVKWTFSAPVNRVEFDVGYFDEIGTTTVKFFDDDGHLLKSMKNHHLGVEHFSYSNKEGIARVVINPDKKDPAGFSVDSIEFSNSPPLVNPTGNKDIDGILWGWKWDHKDLTYSFPTSATEYTSNGYASVTGFEALSVAQQTAYAKIIANFDGICGLTLTQTTDQNADLRFAEASQIDYSDGAGAHVPGGGTAEGNPPDPGRATVGWGDSWFTHGTYETPDYGSFAYAAGLMHELGHSLGLKHGHVTQGGHGKTFPMLPADHNSYEYSVMTYHQYVGDNVGSDNAPDHPTTLMQDDIAALQFLYGADYSYRNGDTTYQWDAGGQLLVDGGGQGTPINGHVLMTIWDGGGNDTYDFSNKGVDVTVDLNPGAWSTFGDLADLGDGHFARGNLANALLYKGKQASLVENANGGSGDDTLSGNAIANILVGNDGNDHLNGRGGNDTLTGDADVDFFLFTTKLNARKNIDMITDFVVGVDFIQIENKIFKGLAAGGLDADNFVVGHAAADRHDRIIYDSTNGSLLFDHDGKGGDKAIAFASLGVGLGLTSGDFLIV